MSLLFLQPSCNPTILGLHAKLQEPIPQASIHFQKCIINCVLLFHGGIHTHIHILVYYIYDLGGAAAGIMQSDE